VGKIDSKLITSRFKEIFTTATFKQSAITFSGTAVNGFIGALFYILSARFLGPSVFGLLSISIASLSLVADIGNLGVNTGLVRFVSQYLKVDPQKANRFLKLSLEIKFFVSLTILFLGYIFSPFLANFFFVKPEMVMPLRLAFIGVGTTLLFSFATSSLQAFQKFVSWSVIQVITNLLRLFAVILFFLIGILDINTAMLSYILMPLVGFLISLAFIPYSFLKIKGEWGVRKEFFNYNKWVASFSIISATSSRLDTFMSGRLLSAEAVGIYSAANQLVQIVPQVVAAISTVISPKMSSMGQIKDLVSYFKKTQLLVAALALAAVSAIPVAVWGIPFLYGDQYSDSVGVFIILLLAMLLFLLATPAHNIIIYYFSKPSFFFWLSLGHLMIIVLVGWNLIALYGAMGAAISVLLGHLFNFIVPLVWVTNKIRARLKNQNKL
jgi:O-antigen/teichoic acid export membrane protein